jgi:hypothetical protein
MNSTATAKHSHQTPPSCFGHINGRLVENDDDHRDHHRNNSRRPREFT